MKVFRNIKEEGSIVKKEVFDIIECTYSGKFMGERSITATISWASPIDFQIGDYVDLEIQSLVRGSGGQHGGTLVERFYIYTMPTIKKASSVNTSSKGFEHTVTFYPAQHELASVQMRDMGSNMSADSIVYTGFDTVTFYGGAFELMERIMSVLKVAYHDEDGNALWNYEIADAVNEQINTALERFPFSFSGNTVMDALLKLSDKEGINTTFYINNRTIYVGFKRPYFCRVTDGGIIDSDLSTQMFSFKYGKTSHLSQAIDHGGLYDITKTVGSQLPITKLFAYGASRNLNRYYCSDRIAGGRYVNRVMLPSFDMDGKTDYIISEDAANKYGIREASKQFEDIYPSLRYMTYGDLRTIKYCIKVKASGLEGDSINNPSYNVARVQCYKVVEGDNGVNTLVESAPQDDIAVYVHAEGKIVKVVLFGGETDDDAIAKQMQHDIKVPTRDGKNNYIPGSCFLVHDDLFGNAGTLHREEWFYNPNDDRYNAEEKEEIKLHQINYTDTFWLTDLYVFQSYDQTYFSRDGYSAWAWPRLNSRYIAGNGYVAVDSTPVNTILGVEPVTIVDTSMTAADLEKQQKTFDIYLGDTGFKIDEQNDFGEMVFVVAGTVKVSILDGLLAGREFEVNGAVTDSQFSCICAYNDDGSTNDEFFKSSDYSGDEVPRKAFNNGAIWRLRLNRINLDEPDYSNLNIALPNKQINAKVGDHLVLLDIFMPDIYIHAAENRLLREAEKYLYANDNGSVNYAVTFDKVRMHQVPMYGLQMREGLNIRVEDNDLDIATENDIVKLFEGELVSRTSMYRTIYEEESVEKYYYTTEHRDYYNIKKGDVIKTITLGGKEYISNPSTMYFKMNDDGSWVGQLHALECMIMSDYTNPNYELFFESGKVTVRLLTKEVTVNGTGYKLTGNYAQFSITNVKKSTSAGSHGFTADCTKSTSSSFIGNTYPTDKSDPNGQFEIYCIVEYDLKEKHVYDGIEYKPSTYLLDLGTQVYCHSRLLTEFKAKKHYEVTMELFNTTQLVLDNAGYPQFALLNNLGDDSLIFHPDCVTTDIGASIDSVIFKFAFDTIDGFNDSQDYYPAVKYKSDGKTDYIQTKLISIIESDYESNSSLQYADFVLDSITIKVSDSGSRPVREISATLSEQHNATAWASLVNRVENTEKESEHNKLIYQEVVETARRHYQTLLNLRNSIFDPDGTCDQTFLQVMMMQVGADSMNYQLRNTRTGLKTNGELDFFNCSCKKESDGYFHFVVNKADTLDHYVFTDGEHHGTWEIPNGINVALCPDSDGVCQPYFISIRCPRNGGDAQWVCETKQRKLNEDATCWYFNWGILTCDSAGVYTLTETRGNAYMYGDNIVAGKISSLAKNSWFDLTNGEFVLGNTDSGAAFSYIDGVLHIGGLPTDSDVADLLIQLGVINDKINNIGGENLLPQSSYHYEYQEGNILALTYLMPLEAGKTYICTYGKSEDNATSDEEWARGFCLAVSQVGNVETIEKVVRFGEPFVINGNGRYLYIAWGVYDYVESVKGSTPAEITTHKFVQYLDYVMVQEGEIATNFQPSSTEIIAPVSNELDSYKYLKKALEDDTDIVGGLVATSQIHLREWTGKYVDSEGNEYPDDADGRTKQYKYTAGISGIDNSNPNGEYGDGTYSDGVSFFAGGEYDKALEQAKGLLELAKQLPILLTKTGIHSKIGCIEVTSPTQLTVHGKDDTKIVIDGGSDNASISLIEGDTTYVRLTTNDLPTDEVHTIEFTGCSDKYVIHNFDGPVSDEVILDSIDFTKNKYSVNTDNGNKILFNIQLASSYGVTYSEVHMNFDVYLGNTKISTNRKTMNNVTIGYGGVYEYRFTGSFGWRKGVTINAGVKDITIRNANIYGIYNGKQYNFAAQIVGFVVGVGELDSWENGSVIFSSENSQFFAMGKNGLQLAGTGGLVQIMNNKSNPYVQMKGLPKSDPHEPGQLWQNGDVVKISNG
jgi:hypothetical protein